MPLLVVYDPVSLPLKYIDMFQQLAREAGWLDGIYIVANIVGGINKKRCLLKRI